MPARRRPLSSAGPRDTGQDAERDADGGRRGAGAYPAYALGLLTLINLLNYTDRNVIFALFEGFYQGQGRAFAIGIYSVGMAFGGVLGIWLGGVLAERYGWRAAFVVLGVPGFLLAILASRLREPRRRPLAPLATTVRAWFERGRRQAMQYGKPLIGLSLLGAGLSGLLGLFEGLPPGVETAVF